MSGPDQEIAADISEPRSLGSHFSARCRWITFAFSMWGFGFLVLQKTSGTAVRLRSQTVLLFLLLFAAGLISLLLTPPPSRSYGIRPQVSLAKLLFLGLALAGLSRTFSSLDAVMTGVEGSLYALLLGAAGLSLLSLGLRQILGRDWRLVTRRALSVSLFVFWLYAAVHLALTVHGSLNMMIGGTFYPIKSWGRLTFLIFLGSPLEVSRDASLFSVASYLVGGPFIWLIASLIPILLLKARSREEIILTDLARSNSKVFGLGLFALGVCLAYAVSAFAVGAGLYVQTPDSRDPYNIFAEEGRSLDVARPVAVSLILASLLLATGILLVMGQDKVKLAPLRWALLGLLFVLAVPSLLFVAGTLSSARPGFQQPSPGYVILPFSIMVMVISLAILLFWPNSSLPSSKARQCFSLLGAAILLASFVPCMAGYYRLVVKDVRVDLVDLGPVGMDERTEVIVSFTLKNRGPECHGVGVEFYVQDVSTYPEYLYMDRLGEGAEVTENMSFQVVTPKTYIVTIYLFRDAEKVDDHIAPGWYLGRKIKKIRIEKKQG